MQDIVSQRSLSVHQEHEVLLRLETAGLVSPIAQKLIDSKGNDLARRVVQFIEQDGQMVAPTAPTVIVVNFEASESQKKARAIMGKHYLGVEEVMTKFGVNFTAEELAALAEIPADKMAALEASKNDYLLVAGYPLTMLDVRSKMPAGTFASYQNAWYNPQTFANAKKVQFGWHLVRKLVVPNSTSTEWSRQKKMVPATDFLPTAELETYAKVLYFAVTGEKVQMGTFARTDTVDSVGYRVRVGWLSGGQFSVGRWYDGANSDIGVASARKSAARASSSSIRGC